MPSNSALAPRATRADQLTIRAWMASSAGASIWVAVLFAANALITGFTVADLPGEVISGHLVDLVSGLTVVACFALAGTIRRKSGKASLGRNIALWVVAGELSTLTPIALAVIVAGRTDPVLLRTLPVSVIVAPLLVAVFALLVTGLINVRATSRELARERRAVLAMRESMTEVVAGYTDELAAEVGATLARGYESTVPGAAGPDSGSERIRLLVDSVVRPLSWRLEDSVDDERLIRRLQAPRELLEQTPRQIRRGDTSARYRTHLGRLVAPWLTALLFIAFDLPFTYFGWGLAGLIAGCAALVVLVLTLLALRRLGARRQVSRTTAVAAQTVVSALAATSFPLVLILTFGLDPVAFSVIFSAALIGAGTALWRGFVARSVDAFDEARSLNESMLLVVTRLRDEARVLRKRLARIVHGKVQSQLIALSMQAGADPTVANDDAVRAALLESLEVDPGSPASLESGFTFELEQTRALWEGVCSIELIDHDSSAVALDQDPVASACVTEVVRESVVNAVKHARATHATITLGLTREGALEVSVANPAPASSPSPQSASGYGSQILDEVTARWSAVERDGEFVVTAVVPLARA